MSLSLVKTGLTSPAASLHTLASSFIKRTNLFPFNLKKHFRQKLRPSILKPRSSPGWNGGRSTASATSTTTTREFYLGRRVRFPELGAAVPPPKAKKFASLAPRTPRRRRPSGASSPSASKASPTSTAPRTTLQTEPSGAPRKSTRTERWRPDSGATATARPSPASSSGRLKIESNLAGPRWQVRWSGPCYH